MIPNEVFLLDLLSNNAVTFFIPPYQRNYEWAPEQCQVLFDDIVRTCEANRAGAKTKHFFGTVTYFRSETAFGQPSRLVLVDGQQRITTTMLFLIALRDTIGDDGLKSHIDSNYLKNERVAGDGEYKVKLKQVETDWQAFKNLVLGEEPDSKEKQSAVFVNYEFFCKKLKEALSQDTDLTSLVSEGLAKFSVVTLELQPKENGWENPQVIFESMNSLGKPLSLADLVRNYLLLGLDADVQDELYRKYWLKMECALPGEISNFIRDYMQARAAHDFPKATDANHKKLYAAFKGLFAGRDAAELLGDLERSSRIYAWVALGAKSGCEGVDHALADLRSVGVTTSYSFLLSLLEAWKDGRFCDADVVEALGAFRVYCLRRRILGLGAGENKAFPLLSGRVAELEAASDKAQAIFAMLSELGYSLRLPNNDELRRELETMEFYSFRYCKFFLALAEETLTKSRPRLADPLLQVEHIMPQSLNAAWEQALGPDFEELHQELVHTIGNLTLIRHNQVLGQRPFSEKLSVYEDHAGLQIAKTRITDRDSWDAEAIRERGEWLARFIAEEVLPIPEPLSKSGNYQGGKGKGAFSFEAAGVPMGATVSFVDDPSIMAVVNGSKTVEFEGATWHLSPLVREIKTRMGCCSPSGSYNGAWHWTYQGTRLLERM